jgi:sec-independent protein translocase protein TatA
LALEYEWLIILVIIVVLFVWGPQKLPEFARSIGQARGEIDKAYQTASNPSLMATTPEIDPLVETARKLGISTEGKTRAQISDEIVATVKLQAPDLDSKNDKNQGEQVVPT